VTYINHSLSARFENLPSEETQAIKDYSYQIAMRKGTTEYALGIIFYVDNGYEAHHPIGTSEKLCSSDFTLPFSIIYGD